MQIEVYTQAKIELGFQHDLCAAMNIDAVVAARAAFGRANGMDLPMSFTYEGRRWDHYSTGEYEGKMVALCYRRK